MLACLAALLSQVSLVLLSFSMCRGRAGPEKSASVLQGRSQGTRWKASCQLVSMLGFFTTCQCFSLICYEGPAFRASPCWLAALWPLQVQANLVALRVLPMLQNGVSVLGSRWGGQLCARFDRVLVLAVRVCVALRLQLFLRMRLRLLYLCLRAWPPCCRKCRWCCCLSRCVGVGQGPRSPPAFCRAAGHRAPGGKLHVSLCRCSGATASL